MKIYILKSAAIFFLSYCNVLLSAPMIENYEGSGIDNAKFETKVALDTITRKIMVKSIPPKDGLGTKDNPYHISNEFNLLWISEESSRLSLNYIQTADVNLAKSRWWNDGMGFIPIGYKGSSNKPFSGTYDGQGYIIDSLFMDNPKDPVGLFSSTDGARISNIKMTNVEIYCKKIGGSIVGSNSSSIIKNCYSNGIIESLSRNYDDKNINRLGGIAGESINKSKVTYCISEGLVKGISSVGGIVGYNSDSSMILNSISTAEISGYNTIGGIGGANNLNSLVGDCLFTGTISGSASGINPFNVGGVVGININKSTVKNCSSICSIKGSWNIGGIVGFVKSGSIVTNCSSNTDIICESNSGGLVGRLEDRSLLEYSSCKGIVNGSEKNNAGLVGVLALQSRVSTSRSRSSIYMNDIEMVGPAARIDESSKIEDSYCSGEFITSRVIDVSGESSMDNLIADVEKNKGSVIDYYYSPGKVNVSFCFWID